LEEEKKKFDSLLDEKIELDEKLALLVKNIEITKIKITAQDVILADLKAKIGEQDKKTNDINSAVEEE
jgi:hypothetical protein